MKFKDQRLFRQQGCVDGNWVDADPGETVEITKSADGEVIVRMPNAGEKETQRAIEAADTAWKDWQAKIAKELEKVLENFSKPSVCVWVVSDLF